MQRLENLLGKENIIIERRGGVLMIAIKFNSFKKNKDEYKFTLDLKISFSEVKLPNEEIIKRLETILFKGLIDEIIRYIKSYDYDRYIIRGLIYSKENLIKNLEGLC